MTDYGIKIAKSGFSALDIPTEATKKNFIILSGVEAHKIVYAGFVTSGSYTHGLGKVPFCLVFQVDSTSTPTVFTANNSFRVTSTQITNIVNPAYIIVFNEGV